MKDELIEMIKSNVPKHAEIDDRMIAIIINLFKGAIKMHRQLFFRNKKSEIYLKSLSNSTIFFFNKIIASAPTLPASNTDSKILLACALIIVKYIFDIEIHKNFHKFIENVITFYFDSMEIDYNNFESILLCYFDEDIIKNIFKCDKVHELFKAIGIYKHFKSFLKTEIPELIADNDEYKIGNLFALIFGAIVINNLLNKFTIKYDEHLECSVLFLTKSTATLYNKIKSRDSELIHSSTPFHTLLICAWILIKFELDNVHQKKIHDRIKLISDQYAHHVGKIVDYRTLERKAFKYFDKDVLQDILGLANNTSGFFFSASISSSTSAKQLQEHTNWLIHSTKQTSSKRKRHRAHETMRNPAENKRRQKATTKEENDTFVLQA